ncbi:MAG: acetyl-CoA carboxylase biotin carboxyl carrier protein subunit [Novosphingobium sp.]
MGQTEIKSELSGLAWKIECEVGHVVAPDTVIMILESMKMEIPVEAGVSGRIKELCVAEGDPVTEDQVLAIVER